MVDKHKEPLDTGRYVLLADYEALEAKLAALRKAAQRLVDRAKNREQEDWAGLADVLELQDALAAKEG